MILESGNSGLCNLYPVGIHFAPRPPRQPINHPEKKNHRQNQPRIFRPNPHIPQHNNVTRRHEQRWNHDYEKRSIHRFTRFPIN